MKKVCVVVPFYLYNPNRVEKAAFDNIYHTLSAHDIIVVKPHSLDFRHLLVDYPLLKIESFDESYFQGHNAFNRFMLADEFYERFQDYEYILWAKLDCYIFSDQLLNFCDKGYDYMSAPQVKKQSFFSKLFNNQNPLEGKLEGCESIALRKVASHRAALKKYTAERDYCLTELVSEDFLWTNVASEFHLPSNKEALSFAFAENPELCYELNNSQLPFACCLWHMKGKTVKFWEKFIKL